VSLSQGVAQRQGYDPRGRVDDHGVDRRHAGPTRAATVQFELLPRPCYVRAMAEPVVRPASAAYVWASSRARGKGTSLMVTRRSLGIAGALGIVFGLDYPLMHRAARLGDADRQAIVTWASSRMAAEQGSR